MKGRNFYREISIYSLTTLARDGKANSLGLKYEAKWLVSKDLSLFLRKLLILLLEMLTFMAYETFSLI